MSHKKNKSKLFLFTAEYPYAVGETFIENEIEYLALAFDEVVVLPYKNAGTPRPLPPKVRIRSISLDNQFSLKDFPLIIKILFCEFSKMDNRLFFLKNIRTWVSSIKQAIVAGKSIEGLIRSEGNDTTCTYYSYWMNEWALALAILKDKGVISEFIFRCGGYDIWDERHEGNYLPFRFYIYNQTSGIYPNSKMGEKYLKKYNHNTSKIKCLYWGTKDMGLNPFNESEMPCIVSCSSLIPLKRVDKIINIIKKLNFPLTWVHFGSGPLEHEISEQIKTLPSNIIVDLKGNVANSSIMEYYSKRSVTCFINVSTTESLPVSIQEAISFGIPVIATNVGGVSEVVNQQTGILLEVDFNEEEAAIAINKVMHDLFVKMEYRKNIRKFWAENFSAEKNYSEFVNLISNNE